MIGRAGRWTQSPAAPVRGPLTHIIILDGTMSSLDPGAETHAGLALRLFQEAASPAEVSLFYEAGIQWSDWKASVNVMTGRGINRQIRRAYGFLASRYRSGDRIILMGYSRGAYAVRSLAGIIDRVGLLMPEHATVRNIRQIYRHYQQSPESSGAKDFADAFCHPEVAIEAVAVWDTVKALGLRLPVLWRWADVKHAFHNHALGPSIRNGFHALALDETRLAYAPVMWACRPDWPGRMEQMWFRGSHGDVGGQLNGFHAARPLANIPFVWLMEKVEMCGAPLPDGWRSRFPQDIDAPSVGNWRGMGKLFVSRRRRAVGACPSEAIHGSVPPGHGGVELHPTVS
ncbi:MAG: DUF2235 domain-containing protein [Pseudomonadota bacterium]